MFTRYTRTCKINLCITSSQDLVNRALQTWRKHNERKANECTLSRVKGGFQWDASTSASKWPIWKRYSTQTQALAKSPEHSELSRREVIWSSVIIMCGKCAYVMPERCFVFTCCSANESISASTSASSRKRKNFDHCACACALCLRKSRVVRQTWREKIYLQLITYFCFWKSNSPKVILEWSSWKIRTDKGANRIISSFYSRPVWHTIIIVI